MRPKRASVVSIACAGAFERFQIGDDRDCLGAGWPRAS